MSGTPPAARRWRAIWLALALLLSLLLVLDLARVWRISNHKDLDVFVVAAQRLAAGEDIYQDTRPFQSALESGRFSLKDESVVWPYAYAPTVALLFRPAIRWPQGALRGLWWGLNVSALLLGSWLSLRALDRSIRVGPAQASLALAMLVRFDPAVVTLRLGQIELLQYLLLALTLYALTRSSARPRWEALGGVSLGLAAAIKFFPGALIALLIWRRRWRPALWALGTALVAVLGSFAWVGWDALGNYFGFASLYGLGGAFAAFPYNQSLNGLLSRNLVENVFSPTLKGWHLPNLALALTLAGSLVLVALSAWLTWHRRAWPERPSPDDDARFALEYGLGITALLLVSPHSQVYAYMWSAIAMLCLGSWLLVRWTDPGVSVSPLRASGWLWAGLVGAYLLIGRHHVFFYPGLTRFVQSHYFFGALALWTTLGLTLYRWRSGSAQGAARNSDSNAWTRDRQSKGA